MLLILNYRELNYERLASIQTQYNLKWENPSSYVHRIRLKENLTNCGKFEKGRMRKDIYEKPNTALRHEVIIYSLFIT